MKKINWLVFFALLLAPVVFTMLVALFKSPTATIIWVLCSSPVAGIISGIMLSRMTAGHLGLRIFLALVFMAALSVFCLVSCFFGCAITGGGGLN